MTRKDYIALSGALASVRPGRDDDYDPEGLRAEAWGEAVQAISDALGADNPAFDAAHFETACRSGVRNGSTPSVPADQTYNGWTNWHTWNTALWLDNEEGPYNEARRIVATSGPRDAATLLQRLARHTVKDAIDWHLVDWPEIVAHYRAE